VENTGVTVKELADRLGVPLEALAANGMFSMGSVLATGSLPHGIRSIGAEYAWDMHHEHPVATPEALARREVTAYRVRYEDGRTLEWPEPAGD
jgi:hypothetical protein